MCFLFLHLLVTLLDQYKRTMTRYGSSSVTSWSKNTAVAWLSPSLSSSLPTYSWWRGSVSKSAVRKKVKSHLFAVSWIIPYCLNVSSVAGALQLFRGILYLIQVVSVLVVNTQEQCGPWRRCLYWKWGAAHCVLYQMQIHCVARSLFSKIQIILEYCADLASAVLSKPFQGRITSYM